MITQAIKHWLNKLFAWWPWRRSSEADYAQVVSKPNTGTTQEPTWRTTIGGSISQPGITSVAIEQGSEEIVTETSWSTIEERPDRATQSQPQASATEENANITRASSATKDISTSRGEIPQPPPTQEQQMAFLQYLVRRGLVNEGFAEGQVPEQYKQKR